MKYFLIIVPLIDYIEKIYEQVFNNYKNKVDSPDLQVIDYRRDLFNNQIKQMSAGGAIIVITHLVIHIGRIVT